MFLPFYLGPCFAKAVLHSRTRILRQLLVEVCYFVQTLPEYGDGGILVAVCDVDFFSIDYGEKAPERFVAPLFDGSTCRRIIFQSLCYLKIVPRIDRVTLQIN